MPALFYMDEDGSATFRKLYNRIVYPKCLYEARDLRFVNSAGDLEAYDRIQLLIPNDYFIRGELLLLYAKAGDGERPEPLNEFFVRVEGRLFLTYSLSLTDSNRYRLTTPSAEEATRIQGIVHALTEKYRRTENDNRRKRLGRTISKLLHLT